MRKSVCSDNRGMPFYWTFALIYTSLNLAAFFLLLLTTDSAVLADDENDAFWIGLLFMVLGIVAALVHGIGPAIVYSRRGNSGRIWLFPLTVFVVGFAILPFEPFMGTIGFLVYPLAAPLFNCVAYNSETFDFMTSNIFTFALAPSVIYALVIFATILFVHKRESNF